MQSPSAVLGTVVPWGRLSVALPLLIITTPVTAAATQPDRSAGPPFRKMLTDVNNKLVHDEQFSP